MKFKALLLLLFSTQLIFAQNKEILDLGPNTKIDKQMLFMLGVSSHPNESFKIENGFFSGDFSKIGSEDYIQFENNTLTIKDCDEEICFTTNSTSLEGFRKVAFDVEISGIGTLDKKWDNHDWIDISYILDGKKTKLSGSNGHTLNGVPKDVSSDWIKVKKNKEIQIEICMRMTGDDESYTIHEIALEKIGKREVAEASDRNDKKTFLHGNTSSLSLEVYPNPSSDWLKLKNEEDFDVNKLQIFNSDGKRMKVSNYPVDLNEFAAGVYHIRALHKNGESIATTFTVVKN